MSHYLFGICGSITKHSKMNSGEPHNPEMRQEPCIANVRKKVFFTLALRGICSLAPFEGDLKGDM